MFLQRDDNIEGRGSTGRLTLNEVITQERMKNNKMINYRLHDVSRFKCSVAEQVDQEDA